MARYQIILAYDGSGFSGSQRQAKSRTVQSELERALSKLGWEGKSVLLAGRTDSGVHASGQVAAFDLEWQHPADELVAALNGNLPLDMAVRAARSAPDDFHPRFDALARQYRYRVFCQPLRDPLREHYAWRVWPALDRQTLEQAAGLFLGQHDFSAFGTPPKPGNSTIRTVTRAEWRAQDDEWTFDVRADAFLYRMVRKLVHTQVTVGQGRLPMQAIADALAARPKSLPGGLAPASGLTLIEVIYPVVTDGSSERS